jgi:hypothetical protein
VISYEDLEDTRAKRAARKAAKEAKMAEKEVKKADKEGKEAEKELKKAAKVMEATAGMSTRGRKRKSPVGAGAPEPKAKVARMSATLVAEDGSASTSWRAREARMY